jgi:hypothetical protein
MGRYRRPADKAVLARAAALERLDLTSFILRRAAASAGGHHGNRMLGAIDKREHQDDGGRVA